MASHILTRAGIMLLCAAHCAALKHCSFLRPPVCTTWLLTAILTVSVEHSAGVRGACNRDA